MCVPTCGGGVRIFRRGVFALVAIPFAGARRGGGSVEGGPLAVDAVRDLNGKDGGVSEGLDRAICSEISAFAASEDARARGGGRGGPLPLAVLRGGAGGAALDGELTAIVDCRAGGGGGALPGVAGGDGTLREGDAKVLLRGGMAGTGRNKFDGDEIDGDSPRWPLLWAHLASAAEGTSPPTEGLTDSEHALLSAAVTQVLGYAALLQHDSAAESDIGPLAPVQL